MANEQTASREPDAADTATQRPGQLRSPVLDDGQPSFHWWLLAPGFGFALLWALYGGVTADGDAAPEFLGQLLWPGVAIFAASAVVAYFGWRLDID